MEDYLRYINVSQLIHGVIGGLIVLGIRVGWLYFTTKGTARQLRQNEAYRLKLDEMSKSDRALIIYTFQAVLLIIASICLMFGFEGWIFGIRADSLGEVLSKIVRLLIWLLPTLACIGFYWTLQNVSDYPKSTEKLDERIAKLKDKVSGK